MHLRTGKDFLVSVTKCTSSRPPKVVTEILYEPAAIIMVAICGVKCQYCIKNNEDLETKRFEDNGNVEEFLE